MNLCVSPRWFKFGAKWFEITSTRTQSADFLHIQILKQSCFKTIRTKLVKTLYHKYGIKVLRRVLLVCHKNKWRDLSQKFVTSLFKTLFLFIEGGQENIFIGPKNIFDQYKNVFLSPFDKKKLWKNPKKWRVFVTNHVTYFCDRLFNRTRLMCIWFCLINQNKQLNERKNL